MTDATPPRERVRAWSEEVARDPDSLAFFPLATAYRARGRADVAVRLCRRGLERHPTHVEAHFLLGTLYREGGDAARAADEWAEVLRLAARHAGARRALGVLYAEREEWEQALRHLDVLAAAGPLDPEVRVVREQAQARLAAAPSLRSGLEDALRGAAGEGVLGALVLDDEGCLLSGALPIDGKERAAEAAAALGGVAADARQTLAHLELGEWRGMLWESPAASVRLAPVPGGAVAVAADAQVPAGWLQRIAERVRRSTAAALRADSQEEGNG